MGFFKSKYEKELDQIIFKLEMNLSNNYKDNAQMDLADLEKRLLELKNQGLLKEKSLSVYENLLDNYKIRTKGNTHKDQKPYWT